MENWRREMVFKGESEGEKERSRKGGGNTRREGRRATVLSERGTKGTYNGDCLHYSFLPREMSWVYFLVTADNRFKSLLRKKSLRSTQK